MHNFHIISSIFQPIHFIAQTLNAKRQQTLIRAVQKRSPIKRGSRIYENPYVEKIKAHTQSRDSPIKRFWYGNRAAPAHPRACIVSAEFIVGGGHYRMCSTINNHMQVGGRLRLVKELVEVRKEEERPRWAVRCLSC